jgi:hypothetical protein
MRITKEQQIAKSILEEEEALGQVQYMAKAIRLATSTTYTNEKLQIEEIRLIVHCMENNLREVRSDLWGIYEMVNDNPPFSFPQEEDKKGVDHE